MKGDPVGPHFLVIDFPKGDGVASVQLIPVGRNGAPEYHRALKLDGHRFADLMDRRTKKGGES